MLIPDPAQDLEHGKIRGRRFDVVLWDHWAMSRSTPEARIAARMATRP